MRVVRIGESSKRERAATPRPFRHAPFWGCDAYIGPLTEQRWDKREGARLVLKFGVRDNSSLPPEEEREREVRKGANGISSANNSSMNGCGPTERAGRLWRAVVVCPECSFYFGNLMQFLWLEQ